MSSTMNSALVKDDFLLVKRLVEKKGFRLTKQRKLILEQFFITKEHLTAEDIYHRLKEANIGLATVYRNVKIFTSLGIIKEVVVDGVSYYELKIYSKKPLHLHFQCISCNDIMDINEREVALEYIKLNKAIENRNDLEIYDVNIMLVGLCNKCRG